tara:strand:+ start:2335 stop:2862 length:528 start_codon:yes stop_codon:yes gene_type:complete
MNDNYFDIKKEKSHLINPIEVENNSFLLFSDSRKNYFKNFSEKLDSKNDNFQGYILSNLFFSQSNIEIIQRQIVLNVFKKSDKKYLIPFQNQKSLEIIMKYIFNFNAKNLPFNITEQIRELNYYVSGEITPMILNNIKSKQEYLREIAAPPPVNDLPVNVNSAGNKTLSSFTSTF